MPIEDRAHTQRGRAESFGSVAGDYDRYRPSYPAALIADLVALRPATVLDIGCGTGKAARLLAASGLRVLGVEPDPKMAALARGHGLEVEVGSFERWDAHGRTFDLIVSAQAWHWVDPVIAAPKAARLLSVDGTLTLFWNFDDVDDATRGLLDDVYARHAPELLDAAATGSQARDRRPYFAELQASGAFARLATRSYPWRRVDPVDDWVARVGTHSDHIALGADRLSGLQAALRAALATRGDHVEVEGGTYTILARVTA